MKLLDQKKTKRENYISALSFNVVNYLGVKIFISKKIMLK